MEGRVEPAMNTIPTIFNEREIPYTILGNTDPESYEPISIVVLNRGGRYYLSSLFKNLYSMGLNSILYIDKTQRSFELESLSSEFPDVKFILPFEELTTGEMINLAMSETLSPNVLVIWSDMALLDNYFNLKLLEKLSEKRTICIPPLLLDSKNDKLPVQMVPSLTNMDFSTEQFLCRRDFVRTLYPVDFMGLYDREKFIKIGGFDYTISNPYWQNLDFAFRANLWSYDFLVSTSLRLRYSGEIPVEDTTADNSYIKFYLKNLAPLVEAKGARLPRRLFFSYAKKSGLNPMNAYKQFFAVRNWVNLNKHKFVKDPHKLISEWEPII